MTIQVTTCKVHETSSNLIGTNHQWTSNGGPASPMEWIMDNIEYLTNAENRHKLLLGFNMYAMSYLPTRAPEPLVLKTVVEKLAYQPKEIDDELMDDLDDENDDEGEELNWDTESQEAWFVDIDEDGIRQGTVWMPTLRVTIFTLIVQSMLALISIIVVHKESYSLSRGLWW
jgi:spore germination protein YaaH